MKPTHLITLSARIEELDNLAINGKISDAQFRQLAHKAQTDGKIILRIGLFVAAKDGKPLEEPKEPYYGGYAETDADINAIHSDRCIDYIDDLREAQQDVIFEGWEVRVNSDSDIVIKNGDLRLVFIRITDDKHLSIGLYLKREHLGRIQSLADLAEATTDNPLKLK
jgi:hypothetical protein